MDSPCRQLLLRSTWRTIYTGRLGGEEPGTGTLPTNNKRPVERLPKRRKSVVFSPFLIFATAFQLRKIYMIYMKPYFDYELPTYVAAFGYR